MIIRRNWPAAPLLVAVGALAMFAVSCGNDSTPAVPSAPVPSTPPPTPDPPSGGGATTSTCPLGEGDPYAPCEKDFPELYEYVEAAIDALVVEQPELFDLDIEAGPGTRQFLVLDDQGYLDGVVSTLRAMGLCAGRAHYDAEIIQVKIDNATSEDYDIYTSDGYVRRGTGTYRQTCTPASFPIARPADAPPVGSGCGWPWPPPVSRFKVKVHLTGPDFDTLDSTPLVGPDPVYCKAIGYTDGRMICAVRQEGDPERVACEAWVVGEAEDTGRTGPTWTNPEGEYCQGLTVNGCVNADNQYQLWASAPGRYTACSQNQACGSTQVEP